MLTVRDAKNLIGQHSLLGTTERLELADCVGLVLAEDILTAIDMPLFDGSAMDGYAIRSSDQQSELSVGENIWAGKKPEVKIAPLHCARIMTGAMLPDGADTVVMQENATRHGDKITINQTVKHGDNVKRRGEEFKNGDLLLRKGQVLTPGAVALAATAGLATLLIVSKPKVCIVVTGSELVNPGSPRESHQIYESNSHAIKAVLTQMGIASTLYGPIEDNFAALALVLRQALTEATHVIVCGGVSVGDYDHNKSVLHDLGVAEIFWKVAQKPGKPLYLGKKDDTLVFGLPGNPASSLICFYEYVFGSLMKYMGKKSTELKSATAILSQDISKKNDFTHFLTATAEIKDKDIVVSPSRLQASHMLMGLSTADCLIVFDGAAQTKVAGQPVTIHWLPYGEQL